MKTMLWIGGLLMLPLGAALFLGDRAVGQNVSPSGGTASSTIQSNSFLVQERNVPVLGTFTLLDPRASDAAVLRQSDDELESAVQQAVAAYGAMEDAAERDKARKEIGDLLAQQFKVREQRRELEIQQIEARVAKLREALRKREAAKSEIIERRLNDLLSNAEGLGWGNFGAGGDFGRDAYFYKDFSAPTPTTYPPTQPPAAN